MSLTGPAHFSPMFPLTYFSRLGHYVTQWYGHPQTFPRRQQLIVPLPLWPGRGHAGVRLPAHPALPAQRPLPGGGPRAGHAGRPVPRGRLLRRHGGRAGAGVVRVAHEPWAARISRACAP